MIVALAATVLAGLSGLAPAAAAASSSATSPGTTSVTTPWFCLPSVPHTAAEYASALNHHDLRWQGGDGANQVMLPDGRILWIFADTLWGQTDGTTTGPVGTWGIAHGSMLIQTGACFEPFYSTTSTKPTSLVPPISFSDVYWPGSAWVGPAGKTLYVMLSRVQITSSAVYGFKTVGNAVAQFDLPSLAFRRIDAIPASPAPNSPFWEPTPFRDGSWVYLQTHENWNHYIARVPVNSLTWMSGTGAGSGWQFWNGSAWTTDPTTMGRMLWTSGPNDALHEARTATGYLMVAKSFGLFSQDVSAWTSPNPMGPWKPLGKVADAPSVSPNYSYGAHGVVDLPGVSPFVLWSRGGGGVGLNSILTPTPSAPLG